MVANAYSLSATGGLPVTTLVTKWLRSGYQKKGGTAVLCSFYCAYVQCLGDGYLTGDNRGAIRNSALRTACLCAQHCCALAPTTIAIVLEKCANYPGYESWEGGWGRDSRLRFYLTCPPPQISENSLIQ